MASYNLRISSVVYDDVANSLTLTMMGDLPPAPEGVPEDSWYPVAPSFNVVVPVKKGTLTTPAGVYVDANAERHRMTYSAGKWSTPVAVDEQGKPKGK